MSSVVPARFCATVASNFPRERLLWCGEPDAASVRRTGLLIWLFAVPWTAFALFWEGTVVGGLLHGGFSGAPWGIGWVFALFGLPFVLLGIGMLASPLFIASKTARTLHLLTERRLATVVLGARTEIASFDASRVVSVRRKDRGRGFGDLEIGFGAQRDSDGDSVERKESWIGVPAAAELEALLVVRFRQAS